MQPPTLATIETWIAAAYEDPTIALPWLGELARLTSHRFWRRVAEHEPPRPPAELWERFTDPAVPLSQWPIEYWDFAEELAGVRAGQCSRSQT